MIHPIHVAREHLALFDKRYLITIQELKPSVGWFYSSTGSTAVRARLQEHYSPFTAELPRPSLLQFTAFGIPVDYRAGLLLLLNADWNAGVETTQCHSLHPI